MNQKVVNIFKCIGVALISSILLFGSIFLFRNIYQHNLKMQFREELLNIAIGTINSSIVNEFGFPDIYLPTGQLMVRYKLKKGRMVELNFGTSNTLIGITEILKDGTRIKIKR